MPAAGAQRFSPPNQPTRWNEANPLAQGLVSLLYFANGQWHESGPYGGQVQCTRFGTVGSDYRVRDQRTGPADAIMYGTSGATANDGYRFIYPGPITTTTTPLTICSMGYTSTATAASKFDCAYSDSGSVNMIARTQWGDNSIPTQDRTAGFLHAGSLNSFARTNVVYSVDTPGFVSCSKSPQTATAPRGFASGVLMGTTQNQNAAWIAAITDVWIGRRPSGLAGAELNGGVAIFGLFTRMFEDAEHAELYRNPWQLLTPTRGAKVFDFAAVSAGWGLKLAQQRNRRVRAA